MDFENYPQKSRKTINMEKIMEFENDSQKSWKQENYENGKKSWTFRRSFLD